MSDTQILIEERIPSDLSQVGTLPDRLAELRQRCPMSDGAFYHLTLLLTEAVTNAIVHGNRSDPNRTVRVYVASRGDRIICYIEDQGEGFEPENVPDPVAPENLMKSGGRGLFIIRSLAQSCTINPSPNGTSIRFSIARGL